MPLNRQGGRWEGGYISIEKGGRETFVIEREVRGQRFHVSTRTHSRRVALKHLDRFETDPFAYRPEGTETDDALVMTPDMLRDFWRYSIAKGNTRKHSNAMVHRLEEWRLQLGARDLRRLTLRDHLRPMLVGRANAKHLVIAIKSFFSWLRNERGLLTSAQDATVDLLVPQARPEKHVRRKAVDWQHVAAVANHLDGEYRDILELLVGTGMHLTELGRFVRHPESALVDGSGSVLAVLVTRHKSGDWTRIPLTRQETVDAAKRLRSRGTVPKRPNDAIKQACLKAQVPTFTLGVMRHSVATWAIERGASPDSVAEFLGHRDKRTTLRFYADVAVPTRTVPVVALPKA